jgi:hypothetical protein
MFAFHHLAIDPVTASRGPGLRCAGLIGATRRLLSIRNPPRVAS